MAGLLSKPLSAEQTDLLGAIHEPFVVSGSWPVWQFVDITLDARSIDAAEVLASLPVVGLAQPLSVHYGMTWRSDIHRQPQPDTQVALTVSGLQHLPEAEPLLDAFMSALAFMVEQERSLKPDPAKVVEVTITSTALQKVLASAGIGGRGGPSALMMSKLRWLLGHEHLFNTVVHQPQPGVEQWTLRVPAALRAYRGVSSVDEYLERVASLIEEPTPPSVPFWTGPLEIPYAVDYLDAVWKSKTGSHLFVNLNPLSVALLTQSCGSVEEFNSQISALADVLAQVVVPGTSSPPQRKALEKVSQYLTPNLEDEAAERTTAAVTTLIGLRHIRVSTQHSDARDKAVAAFAQIGLPYPPPSWDQAWTHIAATAISALTTLRNEIQAGLQEDQ